MKSWINIAFIIVLIVLALPQLLLGDSTPIFMSVSLLFGMVFVFARLTYHGDISLSENLSLAVIAVFASLPLIGLLVTVSNQLFDFGFVLRLQALLTLLLLLFAVNMQNLSSNQEIFPLDMSRLSMVGIGLCCIVGVGVIAFNAPQEPTEPIEFYILPLENTELDRGVLRVQFGVRQWDDVDNQYRVAVGNVSATNVVVVTEFTLSDVDSIEQLIVIDLRDLNNSSEIVVFLYINDNLQPIRSIIVR